ncbi:MAG: YIP1 family protein [Candidatus Krumholzibacteria bacterium]|nr:YIP1 family protein [Candidatus Krumholzibacteria bacterium]
MNDTETPQNRGASPPPPPQDLTIIDVIKEVFTRFEAFAKQHLLRPRPPQQLIMIWLIGMDAVAGSIELESVYMGEYVVSDWFHAWVRIMVGGVAAGAMRYWVAGSLFHVAVLLARGRGTMRTSRYIFLYAVVPVAVVELSLRVVEMLVYGNDYFTGDTSAALDLLVGAAMFAAFLFSARLAYIGMTRLQGADPRRTIAVLVAAGVGMLLAIIGLGAMGGS